MKTVAIYGANVKFVQHIAISSSKFKGGEIGFVDFAEVMDIGDEALTSFDFDYNFGGMSEVGSKFLQPKVSTNPLPFQKY